MGRKLGNEGTDDAAHADVPEGGRRVFCSSLLFLFVFFVCLFVFVQLVDEHVGLLHCSSFSHVCVF